MSPVALSTALRITPVQHAPGSKVDFGATVEGVKLEELSADEFKAIEQALYEHKVLLFPSQETLSPTEQFEFVRRFDPTAPSDHGHNDATAAHKGQKSLLHGIGNSIDLHPEVKLIGGGVQPERFNGRKLAQADHVSYHHTPLSPEEREQGFTRWHRWHMDAALYKTSLPLLTTLMAVQVPRGSLTVRWDDGSGKTMQVPAGATAFLSGRRMYDCLTDAQRALVDNSKVMYAPHPYQWCGPAKGRSNGLGLATNDRMPLEDLPDWNEDDLKVWPMVWTEPHTGERSLQVHSVAVWKLLLRDSPTAPERVVDDIDEVNAILYSLQRPSLEPENVWAPAYEPGMLVAFSNRQLYHSATDYPDSWGSRTMLQAHIAASYDPK